MHVARHLAEQYNDTVQEMVEAWKQVVAGTNHRLKFKPVAPDGTTQTHTATAWAKLDGSIKIQRHERTAQKNKWLSTYAIAGYAIGGVALLAAIALTVVVVRRGSQRKQQSVEMFETSQPAVDPQVNPHAYWLACQF